MAEQLGGGWPSPRIVNNIGYATHWFSILGLAVGRQGRGLSGAQYYMLHAGTVMTLLDEQTIRTENEQYLSDSSILNHRR